MSVRSFDVEQWIVRANKRKEKRLLTCTNAGSRAKIYKKYQKELSDIISIERLNDWADSRKYKILFDSDDTTHVFGSTIFVNGRLPVYLQLFYILHEIGHILIEKPWESYLKRYPMGYAMNKDKKISKTSRHRIDVIAEEIEAWARGKKMAVRLGLEIDEVQFEKARIVALKSYLKWATHAKGWSL